MQPKYNLKDHQTKIITTSRKPVETKGFYVNNYVTDGDLYYHLNSCPFFLTYNDGEVGELETRLLPFFRRFLLRRSMYTTSYNTLMGEFTEYVTYNKYNISQKELVKYVRYISNFYHIFHPSKKFDTILPYFPYQYKFIKGCVELVIRTKSGIRLYVYDFTENPVNPESMNYNGFILQLAGRVFQLQTNLLPTSLACVYPNTRTTIYYSYNPEEKLEEYIDNETNFVRRYGEHCAYCLQKNCSPLIDRTDRFGWKLSEEYGRIL